MRLWSAFKLLKERAVDTIETEPFDVVVLVHIFDTACDVADDLLFFFSTRSEQASQQLFPNIHTLL